MSQLVWVAGALWIAGISAFLRRHTRHAAPLDFWLEAVETFLFLAGLKLVVDIMVWLAT